MPETGKNDASPKLEVMAAGFKDFWQTAHDEFPEFFASLGRLIPLINKFVTSPVNGKVPLVIRALASLASNSFGAVVTLALNGYGHDAMRITRAMFETLVNARYIKLKPSEVDDFIDFEVIRRRETYEYFRQYAPQDLVKVPQATIDTMLAEFAKVESRFTDQKGRLRKTWCKTDFRTCAVAVELGEWYLTFYADASDLQHGNMKALGAQPTGKSSIVEPAPSLRSVGTALRIAHLSVLGVLEVLNNVASLNFDADLKAAGDDYMKAW